LSRPAPRRRTSRSTRTARATPVGSLPRCSVVLGAPGKVEALGAGAPCATCDRVKFEHRTSSADGAAEPGTAHPQFSPPPVSPVVGIGSAEASGEAGGTGVSVACARSSVTDAPAAGRTSRACVRGTRPLVASARSMVQVGRVAA
jgi:hypothetical protein